MDSTGYSSDYSSARHFVLLDGVQIAIQVTRGDNNLISASEFRWNRSAKNAISTLLSNEREGVISLIPSRL